jgi:hypothetical protein
MRARIAGDLGAPSGAALLLLLGVPFSVPVGCERKHPRPSLPSGCPRLGLKLQDDRCCMHTQLLRSATRHHRSSIVSQRVMAGFHNLGITYAPRVLEQARPSSANDQLTDGGPALTPELPSRSWGCA